MLRADSIRLTDKNEAVNVYEDFYKDTVLFDLLFPQNITTSHLIVGKMKYNLVVGKMKDNLVVGKMKDDTMPRKGFIKI